MRQVVNRLNSFQLLAGDPGFQKWMARWETVARKWDEPELDAGFLKAVDRAPGSLIGTDDWRALLGRVAAPYM